MNKGILGWSLCCCSRPTMHLIYWFEHHKSYQGHTSKTIYDGISVGYENIFLIYAVWISKCVCMYRRSSSSNLFLVGNSLRNFVFPNGTFHTKRCYKPQTRLGGQWILDTMTRHGNVRDCLGLCMRFNAVVLFNDNGNMIIINHILYLLLLLGLTLM